MKIQRLITPLATTLLIIGCGQQEIALSENSTEIEKESYALGKMIGKQIVKDYKDIEISLFNTGFKHGVGNEEGYLNDKEIMSTLMAARKRLQEEAKQINEEAAKNNKIAAEKFLEQNKKNKDVQTTKSGLQYKIIKPGKGKPQVKKDSDKVTVHYSGKLLDGTEFDSSYKRNEPATFALNGLIPGWKEALKLMPVGAKWELFIPAKLAYGDKTVGQITPNSLLLFEIELIGVNDKKAEKAHTHKGTKHAH